LIASFGETKAPSDHAGDDHGRLRENLILKNWMAAPRIDARR
jgi:hypothetical protein